MPDDELPGEDEVVPWRWFLKCLTCGEIHMWRWLGETAEGYKRGTWAHPKDQHPYYTNGRHMIFDEYKRWKAEQE